jgi:PAS domain S-box-containing protein
MVEQMPTRDELRRQAEEFARQDAAVVPEDLATRSPAEIRQVFQELHVHQIELEMQNEELRRTQVDLEAARASYFALYDLAPVGYVTVSEPGLIQQANLSAATLLGVIRGALVGRRFSQFVCREDQDLYYHYRQQLLATAAAVDGKATDCELRLVRRDGTAFWVQLGATVAPAAAGTRVFRIVLNDISARKQADEALRKMAAELERRVEERTAALRGSEAKFRTLAEESPNLIFISQGGRAVYANRKCEEVLGYTQEQLYAPDFDFLSLYGAAYRTAAATSFRQQMRGREVPPLECALQTRAGREVAALVATRRIDYGGGPAILGIVTDITEPRRVQKDLAAGQEQLRILSVRLSGAQEDERRRIAQGLHDKLGQSLVAVQLKLALLRQTAAAAAERATLADEIDQLLRDATKEIRELVFELNSPTLQRVGVEDAVEELCEHMEATLGVHFEVQWDKRRRPVAEGLRAVLYRAAHELLLNVAKHAGVARATVRLGGRPGHIRIAVVDRGRGFDAAQVGVTVCRTGGFGLYSIRERLQSVGGTFRVTSAPGKGTQAVIEAPVAAEE